MIEIIWNIAMAIGALMLLPIAVALVVAAIGGGILLLVTVILLAMERSDDLARVKRRAAIGESGDA